MKRTGEVVTSLWLGLEADIWRGRAATDQRVKPGDGDVDRQGDDVLALCCNVMAGRRPGHLAPHGHLTRRVLRQITGSSPVMTLIGRVMTYRTLMTRRTLISIRQSDRRLP